MTRAAVVVAVALLVAACSGSGAESAEAEGEAAPNEPRVLALGEERLLADLLSLGITPIASTANVVVDGGFVGVDEFDTEGIVAVETTDPEVERLTRLDPDVVVATEFFVEQAGRDRLEALGTLVEVPGDDPREQLQAVGEAFDKEEEAEALIAELDAAIEEGRERVAALPEEERTVSVATVYPGPTVAAYVDGPIDVPGTLLEVGATLQPGADTPGAQGGRAYLSEEQIDLLDGPRLITLQTVLVDGESDAVAAMERNPLWESLPAVTAGEVVTLDRLGYPGVVGRTRLVHDLIDALEAYVTYGEVHEVVRLTPSMVRIVLGGDGLADFVPTEHTDQYVNALFLPDGSPVTVPFDLDAARQRPPGERPVGRRYTIRWFDADARQVAIDFVVHGDVGLAGRWANHAAPGDRLQIVGPSGGYAPDPTADAHLMVGDESALPAIGASLERVAPGQRAVAVVVVDDADHHLDLACPGDLELHWVHRAEAPDDPDHLLHAVEALTLPAGRVQPFVHGEAAEVRAVRRHLLGDRGIPREGSSISPYWRRGMTDERWREVKRDWVKATEADV